MLNAGRNMPVVLISISILFKIITNSEAAPTDLSHFCGLSTYTPHSTYQTNLNNVLSSLSLSSNSTQNVTVFNTSTSGHTPPNIAYGLFLCRGDLNATDCHECVAFAATEVLTRCPNKKSAVIWYDECMLRYNNTSFFSNLSETPEVLMINTLNITFADPYLEMLQIVDGLASIASNDSLNDGFVKGFATQEANFTRLKKIYVLTQCTPDLSSLDCYQCLQTAKNRLAQQRQGSRALYPSCTVRFEIYPFYRQITAAPPLALELASLPTLKFGNNPGRQSTTAASRSSTYSNFGNNPGYKSTNAASSRSSITSNLSNNPSFKSTTSGESITHKCLSHSNASTNPGRQSIICSSNPMTAPTPGGRAPPPAVVLAPPPQIPTTTPASRAPLPALVLAPLPAPRSVTTPRGRAPPPALVLAPLPTPTSVTTPRGRGKRFNRKLLVIIVPSTTTGVVLLSMAYWWVRKKNKGGRKQAEELLSNSKEKRVNQSGINKDLPLFTLGMVVAATNNFSLANKLGEGGFGSVYKGQLSCGQEVAIKRLSDNSGQGTQEFINEVTLIAKLQHRNLVRLLGYCTKNQEKMLIYEYMPNKSLDSFIFDKDKGPLIDWKKRFEITLGISRGMLYLHQDSRLRIIHRDLKASNVLLDESMDPKISDFGMARIFGGEQMEATTKRVVGTYGYMSPEYAMEGLFSIKSDVFSFGVLLLEIISGRKNSSYYKEKSLNLIGHVWDLWGEDRAKEIIDSSMGNSYEESEVKRCIHIGLLCVQEYAVDRPTMSQVAFMLCSDTNLPPPKQPAFIFKQVTSGYESSSATARTGAASVFKETITTVVGR